MSLFIKNAKAIVTCDKKDNLFENTNLYIEDGIIKYIGNDIY